MPRDYKHRKPRRRKSARKEDAPGWVWMLCGLAVGLAVALAVFLYDRRDEVPANPVADTATPASAREDTGESAESRGTRFSFYEMLPKFEVVIPEREAEARMDSRPAAVATPGAYVLQAGSFQQFADADRMKATLAMQGIESRIQRVTIDADTWHRVRIGPVKNLAELNRIRRQLREAEIEILLIRVGE